MFRHPLQRRRTQITETPNLMNENYERAMPYLEKEIDEKLRWKAEKVQMLKGIRLLSYETGSKLQLIKLDDLLIAVCKRARRIAWFPDWCTF